MMKIPFILLISSFLCIGVLGQRRDVNAIYYDEDVPRKDQASSMLSHLAHELIRRSAGSTQVLNLNLSNLLLLLVLKAVVYGAGYIGNHAFKGRGDVVEDKVISEGEAALALGYLIGDSCLYRAACEVPHTANEYVGAAEMIFQALKLMPQSITIGDSYESTLAELQKAIDLGLKGQCPPEYDCKKDNINRFLRPQ